MGDRTYVQLSLPKSCLEKAKKIVPDIEGQTAEEWRSPHDDENGVEMICFHYEEVNYANLEFEGLLQENKIPYDKEWEDGGDYKAGEETFRVDQNGNGILKEFESATFDMIPCAVVEDAAKKGIDAVNEMLAEHNRKFSSITWKEQMEILTASNL